MRSLGNLRPQIEPKIESRKARQTLREHLGIDFLLCRFVVTRANYCGVANQSLRCG